MFPNEYKEIAGTHDIPRQAQQPPDKSYICRLSSCDQGVSKEREEVVWCEIQVWEERRRGGEQGKWGTIGKE